VKCSRFEEVQLFPTDLGLPPSEQSGRRFSWNVWVERITAHVSWAEVVLGAELISREFYFSDWAEAMRAILYSSLAFHPFISSITCFQPAIHMFLFLWVHLFPHMAHTLTKAYLLERLSRCSPFWSYHFLFVFHPFSLHHSVLFAIQLLFFLFFLSSVGLLIQHLNK
jgi:hypothetical protein